jgi:Protein of unknown function (DUF3592)
MQNFVQRIGALFLTVGLLMSIGSGYWAVRTRAFLGRAEAAPGTVVALELSRSSDSSSYHPVVRFTLPSGQARTFRSRSGSNPPSYSVGDTVEVLYDRDDPSDSRIDSTFSLWGGPIIVGGLGAVFAAIGGGILLMRRAAARRAAELRATGTPVATRFQSVERNTRLRVNGRSPWQIVTQWQDPSTGKLHLFHSENIWFDPTPHISQQEITAYVDRRDPKRHVLDLSFLPKLAA